MTPNTSHYLDLLFNTYQEGAAQIPNIPQNSTFNFSEDTILITGAAGTIGSALTKRLATSNAKKIIAVDIAESPLYNLSKALEHTTNKHITYVLLDILDTEALDNLFKTHNPTLVFHTAAYKHVPLMESAPYNAVRVNILGTKHVADVAHTYKVQTFVFISTDKAVNPSGIMGMSKKIAENYIQALSHKSSTRFTTARFGNIFGSNGSVVCQFKQQIALGVPLTLTDENITRYFIAIQDACSGILQIASFNNKAYTLYSFNMGPPIKIIDIATKLLQLHNKTIHGNIIITGLRAGEKFSETLVADNETLIPTKSKAIYKVETDTATNKNIDMAVFKSVKPHTNIQSIKALLQASL